MPRDNDGSRTLRVAVAAPASPPTAAADRASRYRARQRGEDVPRRKPGPKKSSAAERESRLRDENAELRQQLDAARLQLRLATDRLKARSGA